MAETNNATVNGLLDDVRMTDKQIDLDLLETQNCFGRLGSQLDEKIEFKNKFGETIWATPIIVDFLRILQLGQIDESNGVIAGVG